VTNQETDVPTAAPTTSDRIEEQALIRAPRERVWRALADPQEFGAWFRVRFAPDATFTPGAVTRGQVMEPGYEHITWEATIVDVVPEVRLSWRWHPYAIEPGVDYSGEPTTLVTFTLEDAPDGNTLLRLTESGFDALPPERRAVAFRMNAGGWAEQMKRVARYVES
jgi:uncharacterized protein YndB with AHSA1/START domain